MAVDQIPMINSSQGEDEIKIKYWLQKIPSAKETEVRYSAHAYIRSCGLMAIAEQMKREGSKYDTYEVVAILQQFFDVVVDRLKQGYSVNVGSMLHFRPSIKGTFVDKEESFNPEKHQIVVSVSEGRRLRDALRHERAELVEVHTHTELIMVDINPEEGVIFLHVKGYRLHQPEEDVHWFVCVDKKVTEIKPLFVKKNGREAMISLPTEIYPVGTSLSLSMRLYKGKNRFAEFVYPEIIEL